MSILSKLSFKDQQFKLREVAILDATTKLLASKGFDLMTLDDVAEEVGISKPSLYKHFKSKDELVGAAMIRLVDDALDWLDGVPPGTSPLDTLRDLLTWALEIRLKGGLPLMPSTSPQVRDMLTRNLRYVTRVLKLNGKLEKLIKKAREQGQLRSDLPEQVILFSYYSRTCDPAVEYLRVYARMADADIIQHMLDAFFEGVRGA
ncbi:TetR/AcrR family transcriptional regulator [Silvimonas iriomotensis]|uniref:TetR family transcriptional regulator n=1 Tax=Silvimonas iriomotensis TaxID=449662 RepID=A0ABQ2P9F1_9NEIS|nr:TetR/AcrR family transcriptional regulator [Silvimonas iriomotensis]GGP21156.1 TetR family transcriptional regulator [Silvimonas iriomotensis]